MISFTQWVDFQCDWIKNGQPDISFGQAFCNTFGIDDNTLYNEEELWVASKYIQERYVDFDSADSWKHLSVDPKLQKTIKENIDKATWA